MKAKRRKNTKPPSPESDDPKQDSWTGQLLRTTRESRAFSIADISKRTKIRSAIIEAVEADDFAKLPATAYTRGLLVQIAKALGLQQQEEVAKSYLSRMESRI